MYMPDRVHSRVLSIMQYYRCHIYEENTAVIQAEFEPWVERQTSKLPFFNHFFFLSRQQDMTG
jgi:hypothetical protein